MRYLFLSLLLLCCKIASVNAQFGNKKLINQDKLLITDLVSGDINGDGALDVIGAGEKGIHYYFGDGVGNFGVEHILVPINGIVTAVDLMDVDNDLDLDIICAGTELGLVYFLNNGTGLFNLPVSLGINACNGTFLKSSDVDGDGLNDIVVVNRNCGLTIFSWLKNLGNGGFSTPNIIDNSIDVTDFKVQDVDADGIDDIVTCNNVNGSFYWLKGQGSGVFGPKQFLNTISFIPRKLELNDLNNDGHIDIIVTSDTYNRFGILLGDGQGGFLPANFYFYEPGLQEIAVVDLNSDGNKDLVFNSAYFNVKVLMATGPGVFATDLQSVGFFGSSPRDIMVQDFNADNEWDLIVSTLQSIEYFSGVGNGAFNPPTEITYSISTYLSNMVVNDMDEDGSKDILFGYYDTSNVVPSPNLKKLIYNQGSANFDASLFDETGADCGKIKMAEMNGDGHIDIVSTAPKAGRIDLRLGAGNGDFLVSSSLALVPNCRHLSISDLDHDGDNDIVFTADAIDFDLAWLENFGNGTFSQPNSLSNNLPAANLTDPADLDNDGDLDVIGMSTTDDKIQWFRNNGNGSFSAGNTIDLIDNPLVLRTGDIDLDGDIDIVCAASPSTEYLLILKNLGEAVFQQSNVLNSISDEGIQEVLIEDVDNDADLDILVAAEVSNLISFWENQGTGIFSTVSFIQGINGPNKMALADMDNDGDKDLICSAFGTNDYRTHPIYILENTVGDVPLAYTIAGSAGVTCIGDTDGFATIYPYGGFEPYSINWSDTSLVGYSQTNLSPGDYHFTITDATGTILPGILTISEPPPLQTVMVSTASVGNLPNGSATAVVVSGNFPVTYLWDTQPAQISATAFNLVSGTYHVTVSDANGCTLVDSVFVDTIIEAMSLNITGNFYLPCLGDSSGSYDIQPNGGLFPFTIQWDNSNLSGFQGTGLAAGDYAFTVTDALGTTASSVLNFFTPPPIQVVMQSTPEINLSGNGTAVANTNAGTPPYNYVWSTNPVAFSDTVLNLVAGTYFVTITDVNGCSLVDSVVVESIIQPLELTISGIFELPCFGDSIGAIFLEPSGGVLPYTVVWNDQNLAGLNLVNLPAGNYVFTLTDGIGGIVSDALTISQPPALQISTSSTPEVNFNTNGTATANVLGGTPPYTYEWGTVPIQTTATAADLPAGIYEVTATDSLGCTITAEIEVLLSTGLLESVLGATDIAIFPNPVSVNTRFSIQLSHHAPLKSLTVFDALGREVSTSALSVTSTNGGFECILYNKGLFLVEIHDLNGKLWVGKVVVE